MEVPPYVMQHLEDLSRRLEELAVALGRWAAVPDGLAPGAWVLCIRTGGLPVSGRVLQVTPWGLWVQTTDGGPDHPVHFPWAGTVVRIETPDKPWVRYPAL